MPGGASQMVGQMLSHYRILEQIGAGGMGVVYRAHDERLERDVAIKVLPVGTLADDSARRRFRKEALTLSKLSHPNIATVHDFDSQDGVDFLVTEYISGVTLDAKLAGGALPEKEVIRLGIQLSEGLNAAHQQGIVHRDLKPANLSRFLVIPNYVAYRAEVLLQVLRSLQNDASRQVAFWGQDQTSVRSSPDLSLVTKIAVRTAVC
jgi:predicted Ser/Thr protein kinase